MPKTKQASKLYLSTDPKAIAVADRTESVEPECRGRHRWRVIDFDFKRRQVTERCNACGREKTTPTTRARSRKPIEAN